VSLRSTGPYEDNQTPPTDVLSATGSGSKEGTEPQQAMRDDRRSFRSTEAAQRALQWMSH
jgi:hypothetical protein